ncbi:MAG: MarR family EPS-associated transcriptional regulator [Desulfobacteraceae bacterium]|nr:MAG: MarR family EPS-associated transcriptional regulator [Desulfobacteraceae bacterium]
MNNLECEESFKILQEIQTNPELTQRGLSSKLNISLGKINFLLKALIDQGFVKVDYFKNSKNKKAYLYALTPQGIEAKMKATRLFIKRKIDEFEKLQLEIQELRREVIEAESQFDTRKEENSQDGCVL